MTTRFSRSETVLPFASIEPYERTATRLVQASTQWTSSFARSAENRTLILGILWACWHLPLFWITVWGTLPTILNMVLYIPTVIFMTIVFTWVFDNTEGSILLAILLHTSFDVFVGPVGQLLPAPVVTGHGGALPMLISLGVTALLLVVFTRGRLGYRPEAAARELMARQYRA